jgi:regulator of sigma E protease
MTPPTRSNQAGPTAEESLPDGSLVRSGIMLALTAVGLFFLFRYFGIDGMLSIGLVVLGLGFVIFIHELGHFAVAKWCDVHVETFSLGFGPAIPGCSVQRGETLYKVAWFPLGGYVKMVGEGGEGDDDDDDPRSFKNKSVGQRMAIISAGVFMNVLFGIACFIFVYTTHGVERPPGVAGMIDTGSPAWKQKLRTGAIFHRIGSIMNPYFDDLQPEVMLSSKGEKLPLVYELPDQPGKQFSILIEPRRNAKDKRPVIGLTPPYELKLPPKTKRRTITPVLQTSAAAQAQPPFELGDTIIGVTDPDHPDRIKPVKEYPDFVKCLVQLAGKEMFIQVRRQDASPEAPLVDLKVPPSYHYVFGLRMRMGYVTAVREDSPAAQAGVRATDVAQGIQGDILDQVEVTETDGTRTRYVTSRAKPVPAGVAIKDLDPERLPDELDRWAQRQKPGARKLALTVLRTVNNVEQQEVPLNLDWDDSWRFNKEEPYSPLSPLSLRGLGLAYQIGTTIQAVEDKLPDGSDSPAFQAGLKKGDVIKAIRFQDSGDEPGQSEPGKWHALDADEWAHIFYTIQERVDFKQVSLKVDHEGQIQEHTLTAVADTSWPLADRGVVRLMLELKTQRASGPQEAAMLGLQRTGRIIMQIYLNLMAMITNRVSPENMGGPIMIATVAYEVASENMYSFILFLGIISINLAVINFLPVPILDGGHMVFLIYEKIRGFPASEMVRTVATIVGLTLILALVVFTTWNDLTR